MEVESLVAPIGVIALRIHREGEESAEINYEGSNAEHWNQDIGKHWNQDGNKVDKVERWTGVGGWHHGWH